MTKEEVGSGSSLVPTIPPVPKVRTGVADAAQHLFQRVDARLGRGARIGAIPGCFSCPAPSVRIRAVPAMTVVLAFGDGPVLDERAERPALQRTIGGSGGRCRR